MKGTTMFSVSCLPSFHCFHAKRHALRAALALALTCGAGQPLPVLAYGDAGWGISTDTLSDLAFSQMSARSMQAVNDAVNENRAKTDTRAKSSPRAEPPPNSALDTGSGRAGDPARLASTAGIEALAEAQPYDSARQREQRITEYKKLILAFNGSVEKLYGVPKDNLATAMTAVLAGGYAAYHNKTFPDTWVKPLYRQMEALLSREPKLVQASLKQKQYYYQVMVGIGMGLMLAQAELAKKPSAAEAARLHQAGGQVLQELLKEHPDRLEFSPSGMSVR